MIRVAVVGDIGSGKSYVAKQFGYPVFNADTAVIQLYKKKRKCFEKLKKVLPKYIISFPVNKKEISKAIIDNKNNLKKIVKIIHPEVRVSMDNFLNKNRSKKIVVLDVPLLIENKINKKKDVLVFIDAKKKEINKKLKKRPNYNLMMFKKLKKLQLPLKVKKKKSNFIIKNNFRSSSIKKSIRILKRKILKK